MRFIPVPQSRLSILTPIFAARIVEAHLTKRVTVEKLDENILAGYTSRSKTAYVDSLEDPKHCVILGFYEASITDEKMASVHLIYSKPEERDNPDALAAMKKCIEDCAFMGGANLLVISDWIYDGCPSTGALWKRWGFVPEQTLYIKTLTT